NSGNYTGGITGANHGQIYNSYNFGEINGFEYVGGICGDSGLGVDYCYNVGFVSGDSYAGGVAGYALFEYYVASGATACYWYIDCGATQGCGEAENADSPNTGAEPKSAAELKTQSTYEGWDFDTVWTIDPNGVINDGYPYLRDLPPVA
ncbi:MAG: hypothetical protein IJA22_02785, partial [Clostridia bacterium]|nr:hypothetical protein [Clostridia bacterium]